MAIIRLFEQNNTYDILKCLPGYHFDFKGNRLDWNGHTFIWGEGGECDFAIVFNRVGKEPKQVVCPKENVWQIIQEPYVFRMNDWMIDNQEQYGRILTHHSEPESDKRLSHYPMLPWFVHKTYDELLNTEQPPKTDCISFVTSNKSQFDGHKARLSFLDTIRASDLDIDIFGSGINFIEDKWDALKSYQYSIAVENSSTNDNWTEKISDCFLSYSLPFYYGCRNIDSYFPEDSYIQIDINKPDEALKIIQEAIKNKEWEKRLPAIIEARKLVLERYNFFFEISKHVQGRSESSHKESITLSPYRRTTSRRIKNLASRLFTAK
ncbi:MAG: glycosyltransferase family 10 [Amphritea sp.]|nr:glycosyltransferase family 10 [Amphritea sp.]